MVLIPSYFALIYQFFSSCIFPLLLLNQIPAIVLFIASHFFIGIFLYSYMPFLLVQQRLGDVVLVAQKKFYKKNPNLAQWTSSAVDEWVSVVNFVWPKQPSYLILVQISAKTYFGYNISNLVDSTQPSNLCSQKTNFKQCISNVENGASGEQVGAIERIIVKNLFKI